MAHPVTIGLDIGSSSVRAAEVTRAKGRPMIDRFGEVALAHGSTFRGVVKNERGVTESVRKLWSDSGFHSRSVRVGLAHQQAVVREIEMPDLAPKDLRRALPHQARDVLPFPVEQAILDFYPLGRCTGTDRIKGLLVAAPKDAVIGTVRAVEKAGLHVESVDLSCFAMLRALASATDGAEALVDVGAYVTSFVIHQDGVPHVVRTIPRGGDDVTALLTQRLDVSTKQAETYKRELGLIEDRDDRSETDQVVRELINEAVRPLVNELRSSVSYFVNAAPGRSVSRVAIVGGGSQLRGFTPLLCRSLGLPVVAGNPLQYVGAARHRGRREALADFSGSSAVSVGLALGGKS